MEENFIVSVWTNLPDHIQFPEYFSDNNRHNSYRCTFRKNGMVAEAVMSIEDFDACLYAGVKASFCPTGTGCILTLPAALFWETVKPIRELEAPDPTLWGLNVPLQPSRRTKRIAELKQLL